MPGEYSVVYFTKLSTSAALMPIELDLAILTVFRMPRE
jgi:hypothetical protein